jgi:hypothetical protein
MMGRLLTRGLASSTQRCFKLTRPTLHNTLLRTFSFPEKKYSSRNSQSSDYDNNQKRGFSIDRLTKLKRDDWKGITQAVSAIKFAFLTNDYNAIQALKSMNKSDHHRAFSEILKGSVEYMKDKGRQE